MRLEKKVTGEAGSATVTAPWDRRKLSRWRATTGDGVEVTVELPRGSHVRSGEVLRGEFGELVRVVAAEESLSEAVIDDPLAFARGAYHLGNRHVPLEFRAGALLYPRDHVLDEMMRRLGFRVRAVSSGFEPELGPYQGHGHEPQRAHGEDAG